jgi:hypothetical protein
MNIDGLAARAGLASWGPPRAQSHYRFVRPLFRFIPESLTGYSAPLFLKRQSDRTLGPAPAQAAGSTVELHGSCEEVVLGFGRIAGSEIEPPNLLHVVNLV